MSPSSTLSRKPALISLRLQERRLRCLPVRRHFGRSDHRDVILSDDEKASNKVMQICVSRANPHGLCSIFSADQTR